MMFLCGLVGLLIMALAITAFWGVTLALGVAMNLLFERHFPRDLEAAMLSGGMGWVVVGCLACAGGVACAIGCPIVKHLLGR